MAYDIEEQESIAEAKAFWKEYGSTLINSVLVVVLGLAGWNGWRWWQQREAAQATGLYDHYQQAVIGGDAKGAREISATLIDQFSGTAYASLAELEQARASFDGGDLTAARAQLRWVVEHGATKEFKAIARERLAGLLLDDKAYDEALALLRDEPPAAYAGRFADRRGDILAAQGKAAEARKSYDAALEALSAQDPLRATIETKRNALPSGS